MQKSRCHKNFKNCLEIIQLENERKQLEKNKIDAKGLREKHKEFKKIID